MNRREMMAWMGAGAASAAALPLANAQMQIGGVAPAMAGAPEEEGMLPYDESTGKYVLPKLGYSYDALEPHIDAQTMELHHSKHHQGYVNGLNSALLALEKARDNDDYDQIRSLSRAVSFNGGGHALHTLFWRTMAPAGKGGGGEPKGELKQLVEKSFGSVDRMKAHFSAAAAKVEGSGWGIMGYERMSKRLIIIQGENQQKLTTWEFVPILAIDVWEHAYYLKYQNRRADYIKAWWNVVNWEAVKDYMMDRV